METIENVGLMLITAAGLWVLVEHLVNRWTQQAERRHYWEQVKARMDESRW